MLEKLGAGKKPAVEVSLNGLTYRSTVGSPGGDYLISVSSDVRKSAGIEAGDTVEVWLELDTAPRQVEVPEDLAAALAGLPEAQKLFEGLSCSNKMRHVLSVEDAKTPETRQRRIEKAVAALAEGKK
ncbi:MAG TPA: YdeI/OmpD-associated family protein [Fimbriimonas sp.]|nr:YdeI/OmpD-associated family protein [Fimbriimonas sp.]